MCRSVYLSGLLMSHGTDSVRTRRATTQKKPKRNNEAVWETEMKQCSQHSFSEIRGSKKKKKNSLSGRAFNVK